MRCPFCKSNDDKVIDSRSSEGGTVIRRRRACQTCKRRFTTYERIEETVRLAVIKRDGTRVAYDREKVVAGLQRACWKRPVSLEQMNQIAEAVEEQIFRQFDREVPSRFIGEEVAKRLRRLDSIAYVRYASVYRQFQDVGEFIEEAQEVMERALQETPGQQELFAQEELFVPEKNRSDRRKNG